MTAIVWFREDLRLRDNPAFHYACRHENVIALYIISQQAWQQHDIADCRKQFIFRQLEQLSLALQKLNIALQILDLDDDKQIPSAISKLMQQYNASDLYINLQYEYDELQRDRAVAKQINKAHHQLHYYHDQTIFPPGTLCTGKGEPFKVFTPFKKAWLKRFCQELPLDTLPLPRKRQAIAKLKPSSLKKYLSKSPAGVNQYWAVGEDSAKQQLKRFAELSITNYQRDRDFPALAQTSHLSPYLAAGIISSKTCLSVALFGDPLQSLSQPGIATWVNELIWREFYKHVTYLFPHVCKHKCFKDFQDRAIWQDDQSLFDAWCQARTGYPLVDAAMRQLLAKGWMHNRLRMVVAMFLTKDLLIDWRWGEKFFMQHLIDGDFSANNGGWQWSAGIGVDAAPYFRIFNPITQSERFDKDGEFIRQYCPELANLDNKSIHFPSAQQRQACKYPAAIVDHKQARELFLQRYKKVKG